MSDISVCRWLDSNHRPLVSEATALPTEPQPLPKTFLLSTHDQAAYVDFKSTTALAANLCQTDWTNLRPVWPDWAIYWTLGNFLKPLATISLPKSPIFLGNFSKGLKIFHFSSESFLGKFYSHLAIFFWSHCFSPTICSMAQGSLQHLQVRGALQKKQS